MDSRKKTRGGKDARDRQRDTTYIITEFSMR